MLAGIEASSGGTEALRIDHRRLLHQDARVLPVDGDGRAKARRTGGCGGRRNHGGTQVEELVGLYDDRKACAALLVPSG